MVWYLLIKFVCRLTMLLDGFLREAYDSGNRFSSLQLLSPQHLTMKKPVVVQGYRYFGPATASLVNVSAVWLDGEQLCNPPASVAGRVVVSDGKFKKNTNKEVTCLLSVAYERLAKVDAAGYVALAPWPTAGIASFWHDRWDMSAQLASPMPLVELPASHLLESGKTIAEELSCLNYPHSTLRLTLDKQHYKHDVWFKIHTGLRWIIPFRIINPALYSASAVDAACEFFRRRKTRLERLASISPATSRPSAAQSTMEPLATAAFAVATAKGWSVAEIVCSMEAVALSVLALGFLLGQFGPMMLPFYIHSIFASSLSGLSLYTTLVLALFMEREASAYSSDHLRRSSTSSVAMAHGHAQLQPRASFFQERWIKLSLLFVMVPVLEVVINTMNGYGTLYTFLHSLGVKDSSTMMIFFFMALSFTQVVCAVYFLFQAHRFSAPMVAFLQSSQHVGHRSEQQLGRLLFWIAISAACMLLHTFGLGWMAYIVASQTQNGYPLLALFTTIISRYGVSHAQIQSVKRPASAAETCVVRRLYNWATGTCRTGTAQQQRRAAEAGASTPHFKNASPNNAGSSSNTDEKEDHESLANLDTVGEQRKRRGLRRGSSSGELSDRASWSSLTGSGLSDISEHHVATGLNCIPSNLRVSCVSPSLRGGARSPKHQRHKQRHQHHQLQHQHFSSKEVEQVPVNPTQVRNDGEGSGSCSNDAVEMVVRAGAVPSMKSSFDRTATSGSADSPPLLRHVSGSSKPASSELEYNLWLEERHAAAMWALDAAQKDFEEAKKSTAFDMQRAESELRLDASESHALRIASHLSTLAKGLVLKEQKVRNLKRELADIGNMRNLSPGEKA